MSLADLGILMDDLSLNRRILVFAPDTHSPDNQLRNVLDLQVPFSVAGEAIGPNLNDLNLLADVYSSFLQSNQQSCYHSQGKFHIIGAYPTPKLHHETLDRLLTVTKQFVRSVCFGMEERINEWSFEVDGDLPTQRILFRSWGLFSTSASTPEGRFDLQLSYPDVFVANRTKRPIDEIDAFLAALQTWCVTTYIHNLKDVQKRIADRQADVPDLEVPEHCRKVEFNGYPNYTPISDGYSFDDSYLRIIANGTVLPGHVDLEPVLAEFRQQLIEQVPSLSN